jgi:hypothetical protein
MMPKFGNSSTRERIEWLEHFIRLVGIENIECLLADREFIGQHWLSWLNHKRIKYHIRIKGNFWIDISRNGHKVKAFWLFNSLRINQHAFYERIVSIKGQLCYLSASRVLNKNKN